MTKWRQYDNYECVKCQYATLWLEKMLKHLALGIHVWAHPKVEPNDTLSETPHSDKLEY